MSELDRLRERLEVYRYVFLSLKLLTEGREDDVSALVAHACEEMLDASDEEIALRAWGLSVTGRYITAREEEGRDE